MATDIGALRDRATQLEFARALRILADLAEHDPRKISSVTVGLDMVNHSDVRVTISSVVDFHAYNERVGPALQAAHNAS